jgi:hypothetical protein
MTGARCECGVALPPFFGKCANWGRMGGAWRLVCGAVFLAAALYLAGLVLAHSSTYLGRSIWN